ncbi:Retrotransposon-like protein 1 [Labeo rohita]|uniref:Retrotransposon-like protein 1 n=1 Tax=Labeo rohita TaxID=84645 RepID=A0ABQ8LBP6_LABRO|nr:Retrotransposon-like protein 1 [Labeo rohita]
MSLSPFHFTLTVTLHFGLHLPSSTALIASAPSPAFSDYRSPYWTILSSRLRHSCLLLSDPACTTMYLSRPYNKSSRMDPLASHLVHPVTEQSVTQGSSSFTPGHSEDMNTDRILFRIKQGSRSLDQHIREFLSIANHSTLPDCIIMEIFCDCINEPLKARLRREGPHSSLAAFMNFALLCVGSPCTVGVAKEERDNAVMATARPTRRLAVMPEHDPTNTFAAWIAREMAAVQERAQAMAKAAESAHLIAVTAAAVHKMAAASERVHETAATTKPVHKMAATAVPICKMAAAPACAHKMAATAEPVHKMAAKTELCHVTAAIPEPYKVAAAFPESSQVSNQVTKPSQAAAVPCQVKLRLLFLCQVRSKVRVPVSSQVKAVFPVSSQVRAIALSQQVTPIFPEPSTVKMAATPDPLHKMAATPEPLHKMAAVSKPLLKMAAVSKPLHKMAALNLWS